MESESVISVAWDVFDCEFLRLSLVENANALMRPQVKDFDSLTLSRYDTDLFKAKPKVMDVNFSPVNDHCDDIATCQSCCINRRGSGKLVEPRATQVASCLFRIRILVDGDQVSISEDVE